LAGPRRIYDYAAVLQTPVRQAASRGISRAGDERLRQLLVLGATAVIQHAKPRVKPAGQGPTGRPATSPWLLNLLGRKPRKLAAVALANKMARIVWAMMTSGEAYRPRPATA
jgi:transposase